MPTGIEATVVGINHDGTVDLMLGSGEVIKSVDRSVLQRLQEARGEECRELQPTHRDPPVVPSKPVPSAHVLPKLGHAARIAAAKAYAQEQRVARQAQAQARAQAKASTRGRKAGRGHHARISEPAERMEEQSAQKRTAQHKEPALAPTAAAPPSQVGGKRSVTVHPGAGAQLLPPIFDPKDSVPASVVDRFRAEYRAMQAEKQAKSRAEAASAVRSEGQHGAQGEKLSHETAARREREAAAMRKLEALHAAQHAADLAARRQAQKDEADREAQRAIAQSRAPAWWPREARPQRQAPRPPSPRTFAAAEARLAEVRAKLAAGQSLTKSEESDAVAIIELGHLWADAMNLAAKQSAQHARVQELNQSVAMPTRGRRVPPGRAGGYEAAALMVGL